MAHTESTLQDRRSFLRLFDVWSAARRGEQSDAANAVQEFRNLSTSQKQQFAQPSEPQSFEEVEEFILYLYNDLDYSRTMARHYFDAIQSYCERLDLDFYDYDEFYEFRQNNLDVPDNPNFDQSSIFTLDEIQILVDELNPPQRDFVLIQYLHCRRPGEVTALKASNFDFEQDTVTYNIKKQKYGDDNRRNADIVNEREKHYLQLLVDDTSGFLFPQTRVDLEWVRRPFRRVRDENGLSDLPLKNLRHTRISQLKTVGWESEEIRDTYTHHKQLSTLQNRYLSSVDDDLPEDEFWGVIK